MSDFNQHKRGGARREGFASSNGNKFNGRAQSSRYTRDGQWGDRQNFSSRDSSGNSERRANHHDRQQDGYKRGGFGNDHQQGGFGRGRQQYGYNRAGFGQPYSRQANGGTTEGVASSNPWDSPRSYNRPQRFNSFSRPQQPAGYERPQRGGSFNKKNDKRNVGKRRIDYKEEAYDPNKPIRLNKYLANAGVCSRRDADKYIEAGVVKVNGEVITELGHKVLRSDEVLFHDQLIKAEKKIYVLLNKPKGYVTTSEDPQNRKTVMDLVRNACMERIYPVGRLDRNTTGVLLLTNDGEMASKLTHPKFLKKKIYHVYLDRNVTAADLRQIAEGITLEDGDIRADAVDYASDTDKKQVGIEIHSGKNRIVRRIFAALGYNVVKLDRVYFAGLTKKNVKRGDWRYLSEEEVRMLRMGAFE